MGVVKNLIVRVGADLSELQKEMDNAGKFLKSAGKELEQTGKTLTAALTLPLAGLGAVALKAGMDFEQGMSSIKAVTGASAKDMAAFKELALKMGAETKYSALDARSGIEELAKAGVSTADILNGGLKGALSLAAAGDLELADAAEIASTVLNAFRKDALSVSQAADILAGAANASATDVTELKLGLSMVSAVASGVGLSFKDTAIALAVFAQNGLKGSDAGTSLKTMLLNLQPTTDKAYQTFKEFGFLIENGQSAFYNANGSLKSMSEISQLLNDKLKGLTDAQRQSVLQTMFGTDAIRAANILYKEGANGVNGMWNAMSKVTAADVAKEKMNNLKGSLENLKGSLETAMIKLYDINSGPLKTLIDNLTDLTNAFSRLSGTTQQFILLGAGIAAALGPAIWILGAVTTKLSDIAKWGKTTAGALSAFSAGTKGLGATLTAVFGPAGIVLLVVAAIAAVVAGLKYLYNTNDWFRNQINAIWTMIQASITAALQYVAQFWAKWGGDIVAIFKGIGQMIGAILGVILIAFMIAWPTISAIVGAAVQFIGGILGGLIKIIRGVIDFIIGVFTGDWDRAWKGIKSIFMGIWDTISGYFKGAVDGILGIVGGIVKSVKTAIEWLDKLLGKGGQAGAVADKLGPLTSSGYKTALVGHNAMGTDNWRGGLTWVGERGPELVNLPRGSQVIPNHRINVGGGGSRTQNINIDKFIVQDKGDENRNLAQLQFLTAAL